MIKIFDTTLRDGEQSPGCSMNLKEKLQIARQLERMNVDVIEAGFAISSNGDFESVKRIAQTVEKPVVASLARALEKDIDAAWRAVKDANNPRIHTFLATSPIHLQYKLKISEEQAIERAVSAVKYAKKYCHDVEFSAEDATRTSVEFLVRVFEAVIDAGATVVNIPDTVGYVEPFEYFEFIKSIKEKTRGIENVDVSVHCHNDLGMAVSNSLAAIKAGATQVECTVNGIGERAGNAALEEVVMNLEVRKDIYKTNSNVITTELTRSSNLLQSITGSKIQANKAVVGVNAFAHESGIHQHGILANKETYEIMTPESVGLTKNNMVLGKHSGKHALKGRLKEMGYEVVGEELDSIFNKFKILADEKKTVYDQDIEALIIRDMSNMINEYELIDYSTMTSENKEAKTTINIKHGDENLEIAGYGKGPIDAAFDGLEKIFGKNIKLEDFSICSVTKGKDALGETTLKLSKGEKVFNGKGISNDIIKSSILAYINGINHFEYFTERTNLQESRN